MGLNVLVVDDEKKLTDMIAETLKQFNAFRTVLCSYDGVDAMRKIQNQKFDLVILDIEMPKRGGLEVLELISSEESCQGTQVIMISGNFTPETIGEAKGHTQHFLAKPFKIEDLKLKIGQVLKNAKQTAA